MNTDTQTLIKNAKNLENGNFAIVAGMVVLLYDWMTSFSVEYEHFWQARWNLGTILFFMNRIVPILTGILHLQTSVLNFSDPIQKRMCAPLIRSIQFLNMINLAIVQVLLTLRTYALYDCSQPLVLYSLLAFIVAGLVNQFASLFYFHSHAVPNHLPAPYTGCLIVGIPPWSWERLVPILAFEFCALALTLWKFLGYINSGTTSNVPKILYRDGFIGFLAIIFTTSFGILVQIFRLRSLLTFANALTPVVPTLIATHMLLNIRDVMKITSTSNMMRRGEFTSLGRVPPDDSVARREVSHPNRHRHMGTSDAVSLEDLEMHAFPPLSRQATYDYDYDYGSGRTGSSSSAPPFPVIVTPRASELKSGGGEYWEDNGNDNDDDDDANSRDSVIVVR